MIHVSDDIQHKLITQLETTVQPIFDDVQQDIIKYTESQITNTTQEIYSILEINLAEAVKHNVNRIEKYKQNTVNKENPVYELSKQLLFTTYHMYVASIKIILENQNKEDIDETEYYSNQQQQLKSTISGFFSDMLNTPPELKTNTESNKKNELVPPYRELSYDFGQSTQENEDRRKKHRMSYIEKVQQENEKETSSETNNETAFDMIEDDNEIVDAVNSPF
jgi:hypothetical protein